MPSLKPRQTLSLGLLGRILFLYPLPNGPGSEPLGPNDEPMKFVAQVLNFPPTLRRLSGTFPPSPASLTNNGLFTHESDARCRDALAISMSLFFIVMTSVLLGSALPFGFARTGVDPAHAGTSIQVRRQGEHIPLKPSLAPWPHVYLPLSYASLLKIVVIRAVDEVISARS